MVLLEDAKLDQPHLRLLCGRGLGDIGGAIFFCDNKACHIVKLANTHG